MGSVAVAELLFCGFVDDWRAWLFELEGDGHILQLHFFDADTYHVNEYSLGGSLPATLQRAAHPESNEYCVGHRQENGVALSLYRLNDNFGF